MVPVTKLKELLVDYRNSVKNELSDDELSQIDQYINKIVSDLQPAFEVIKKIGSSDDDLKSIKNNLDELLKVKEWQEKH
jgi:hypothetical protein